MQIYKKDSIFIKFAAFFMCALILFISPSSKYLDVYHIDKVEAMGGTIVAEAGSVAWEWLLALFASLGLSAAAYENKEALMESYNEYLQAQIDTEMFVIDNVEEKCIQVYDNASNTVQNIPWNDYLDSIQSFHDVAVDNLTDVYIKMCPSLLGTFEDFITSVFNGEIVVPGFPDIAPESFTSYDDIQTIDGKFNISGYARTSVSHVNDYNTWSVNNISVNEKVCLVYSSNGNSYSYNFYSLDSLGDIYYITLQKGYHAPGTERFWNVTDWSISSNFPISLSFNIPIFSSYDVYAEAFNSGDYSDALNYIRSIYDTITDNNDLPTIGNFGKELWEVVSNASDWGIGTYGDGALVNDWADDLPYIGLDDLWEYANTRQDVFEKVIDDIISGVFDPTIDIPDTYVDVWKDVISNGWDDVIDNPVNNPAKDPTKPVDPSIPVDPDIPGSIELDIPIADIVPTIDSSFSDIAGSIKYKFPFSIPWDLHHLFVKMANTPMAPYFELPIVIQRYGIDEKIIVDMSRFQKLSNMSRTLFSLIFVLGLIKLTMLVVGMRKEE